MRTYRVRVPTNQPGRDEFVAIKADWFGIIDGAAEFTLDDGDGETYGIRALAPGQWHEIEEVENANH